VRIIIVRINKSPTVIPLSLRFISKNIFFNITCFINNFLFYKSTEKILSKYKKNIKKLKLLVFKAYKNIRFKHLMNITKLIGSNNTPNFYSNEMIITKKILNENQLKYTYQKKLISDLDFKHKEWSKIAINYL